MGGGVTGLSLLSYARNALQEDLQQSSYAVNFLRNQAAPSGLITVKQNIAASGLKRLRQEVEQMYSGTRKAGRIMIGDDGIDFKAIGLSPQDSEFLASRKFTVEQIARFFGVPPQLIGVQDKQTLNNYEQAGLQFLQLGILPWVVRFEQEVNRKLLNRAAAGRARPFLKVNTSAVVRANIEAQYRSFSLGRQWGWLSVNDIRRLIDMDPIGPEGDVYLQPMNMEPSSAEPATDSKPKTRKTITTSKDKNGNMIAEIVGWDIDGQEDDPPPVNLRRIK